MADTNFEQLTVSDTAGGFTTATYQPGGRNMKAVCSLRTAPIHFRIDGTAPTATVGELLQPGDTLILEGIDEILNFKAIRKTSTSGVFTAHILKYS